MKAILVVFTITCLSFFACKSDALPYEGNIIGYNDAFCGCCNGWLIETTDTILRTPDLPEGWNLDTQAGPFPVSVKFDYEADTSFCGRIWKRIYLTGIQKQ